MADIFVTYAQYLVQRPFNAGDNVTLQDSSVNIEALTAADFTQLFADNVDSIDSTDDVLTFTGAQAAAIADTGLAFDVSDFVLLADTGANISALTATQIGSLASKGLAAINPTDAMVTFSVAQFEALGAINVDGSATETIADTGANLGGMAEGQYAAFEAQGVDFLDATDDVLSITVGQYQVLGGVQLTGADVVTLADTGVNIAALTATQIGDLAGDGIDTIDASDDALSLSVAQYQALGAVTLTAGDTVTLADTGATLAGLTNVQIAALEGAGIDSIDATDNVLSLGVAQYQALGAVTLTGADDVTLADSGANIAALTAGEIGALAGDGIDHIDATNGLLTLDVAQFSALGVVTLAAGDSVTISDTAANITTLDFSTLAGKNVDFLDFTTAFTLDVARYTSMGATKFTTGSTITLADTSTNLNTLTVAQFGALAGNGIDTLDATNGTLNLTVARLNALGTVSLTAADTNVLRDTAVNLQALTSVQIGALAGKLIDRIDSTNDTLTLDVAKFNALGTVVLTALDVVTLADTGANLATLNYATLAAKLVDVLDATDNVQTLSVANYNAIAGTVTLAAGDTVTIADTGANLATLNFANLAANGVDVLNATDDVLTLTVAQYQALGVVQLTLLDVVTLADTGANIAALTAVQFGELADKGIDKIDATDNVLSLTVAQYQALGAVTLTGGDAVTLADTGANIAAMTAADFVSLDDNGIDVIDATDNVLTLTAAKYAGLGTTALTAADAVTLADTGANLAGLSFASFAANDVDVLDASDNTLSLSVSQYTTALAAGTALTGADSVTISDTGAALGALSPAQIGALAGNNVDALNVTSGNMNWTIAKWQALGITIGNSGAGNLVVLDSQANIEALNGAQLGALATAGATRLNATSDILNFTAAQAAGFLGTNLVIVSSDLATLVDSGANIGGLTAVQVGQLDDAGFDAINANDDVLSFSVAQFSNLGTVTVDASDVFTLADTSVNLINADWAAFAAAGGDFIDATDDSIQFTLSKFDTISSTSVKFTPADDVILSDTNAALFGAKNAAFFGSLAAFNIDHINLSDDTGALSVAQYQALGTVTLTAADDITLADAGANIAALTAVQIGDLAGDFIDHIDATDNAISFSKAQLDALGTVTLAAGDVITFADAQATIEALGNAALTGYATQGVDFFHASDTSTLNMLKGRVVTILNSTAAFASGDTVTVVDSGANIAGFNVAQIGALAGKGVDALNANDDALDLTVAKYNALGTVVLTAGDVNRIVDTGAHIATLTPAAIGALAGKLIDAIDASDDALSLSVAQYQALGTVTLTAGDTVTLFDTGANIAALSAVAIGDLAGDNIDVIDASDDNLTIDIDQYTALGTVTLTPGDNVVVAAPGNQWGQALSFFQGLGPANVDQIDSTTDFMQLYITALDALATGNVALSPSDVHRLADDQGAIEALTAAQIAGYSAQGVDEIFTFTGFINMNASQIAAVLANTITFESSRFVTLTDTGANIAALTAVQFGQLAGDNVDAIDATTALNLAVDQYRALGTVVLTDSDTVTLLDTGANLASLTTTEIGLLDDNFIDALDASNGSLTWSVAQYNAKAALVSFTGADSVTLSDTAANITGLDFSTLAAANVDHLDVTTPFSLNVTRLGTMGAVDFTTGSSITLADTGANLAAMSAATIGTLAGKGIDFLDSTTGTLSLNVAKFNALGTVALTGADTVTLADTGANLATLDFSTLAAKNVDVLDATNDVLSITAAQFLGLGTVTLSVGDLVTLADTGANISALTAAQFATLDDAGVDVINATNNVLGLTVAQYRALGTTTLTGGDTITLSDTGANIATLTAGEIAGLAGAKIDIIDSTDNIVMLTVAQYQALGGVALKNSDTVTIADTGANIAALTAGQITALASKGVDAIDATDDVLSLTIAKLNAFGLVTLNGADVVTMADTAANIEALSAGQLSGYATQGVDIVHANGGSLSMSAAQIAAVVNGGMAFLPADTVTLFDTGANIAALSAAQFGQLASQGVDVINASDNTLNLTVAQYSNLGTVTLTGGDNVTLFDTGANLAALTPAQITAALAAGVDHLDASNDAISLNVAQVATLANSTLSDPTDVVTLADTGANISAMSAATIGGLAAKGVDTIDASSPYALSVDQYFSLGTVTLTGADDVTLADSSDALESMSAAQIGALAGNGIDHLDATDNELSFSKAKLDALGVVTLAGGDTVTFADTQGTIEGLSAGEITGYATQGVDIFDSNSDSLSMSAAQVTALLASSASFAALDTVTLSDTGANIAGLSAAQFGQLAAKGVDTIDASTPLSLAVAQYLALGTVTLTGADTVTLADSSSNINSLTTAQFGALAGNNIDIIDATNNNLNLSVAKYLALGTVALTAGDQVTIVDTGAHIAALSVGQIAGLAASNVDRINANDDVLSLNVAQYQALGTVTLNGGDIVTLADSGANISALSAAEIGDLAGDNIDIIDATDNAVALSKAQLDALGSVTLTAADTVRFADTQAVIGALTGAEITAYAGLGVDIFDSANDSLLVSTAQVTALLASAAAFAGGDTVVLTDSSANIQALSAAQFGQLGGKGVDRIDSTDPLALTVAQYTALGTVNLTGADTVTLADTGANIAALSAAQFGQLNGDNVDVIDATDNNLDLTVAQYLNLNGVQLTAGDSVILQDTGTALAGLTVGQFGGLAGNNVDRINSTTNALTLSVSQYQALNGVLLTNGDVVTLSDAGAVLSALTPVQLAALAGDRIDIIDASDNAVAFSKAQIDALGTVTLTAADIVTLGDGMATIQALTAGQITAYIAQGVDVFNSNDNFLTLTAAQIGAVVSGAASFGGDDLVIVSDTGANVAGLSIAQFALLGPAGVDQINATDDVLTLNAGQYNGLGGVTIAGGDVVAISDTGANIGALSAARFAAMQASGIDTIDASDNVLALTVAQYNGLGTVALTGTDVVTLADTGANLGALTAVELAALAGKGIDKIDATDNVFALSRAEFNALGTVTLATGDTVTMADTGAVLASLAPGQINNLEAAGIDRFDATDDVLSLTTNQYNALGTIALTGGDTVTLADTGAALGALSASKIGGLASNGIDIIDATDNAITFTLGKYNALGTVNIAVDDVVTVNGTTGVDLITGRAGSQILNGLDNNDSLFGDTGDDTLNGGLGNDTLNGGLGSDTVTYADATGAVTVDLFNGATVGAAGVDLLSGIENAIGSGFADTFTAGSGVNALYGGAGGDTFNFGANFAGNDTADGGMGNDTVTLNGDYSSAVTLHTNTLVSIETIQMTAGNSYSLKMNDANVAAGQHMTISANALGAANSLTFTGKKETNGTYTVNGGAGADTITGGAGNDVISGRGGKDVLAGGAGDDHFVYTSVAHSTGAGRDTVKAFDTLTDHFDLNVSVTGVDAAVNAGAMNEASFDADLGAAIGAGQLGASHAVLFTANSGDLAGKTFLVIDGNGVAGYQAGADFVIQLDNLTNPGSLGTGNFI